MTDIKVLIVSSSPAIHAKIESQLSACPSIRVVEAASANEDILMLTWRSQPDVLVLHTTGSRKLQTDLLFRLKQAQPNLKTLVLALECSPEQIRTYFIKLAPWGLRGYICKWEGSSELIDAICTLRDGDSYLCPMASHILVDAYRDMLHHVVQKEI